MNTAIQYIKDGQLAYLDYGKGDNVIVALHGHFGRSRYFAPLAEGVSDSWRVIALDQRGHGWSAWTEDYSRDSYLDDIHLLLDALGLKQVVLVGFSLGGVNAYQYAARHPERLKALVIEDIGAVVKDDLSYVLEFPERFSSISAARDYIVGRGMGSGMYFLESIVEHAGGWGFRFDKAGMVRSQQALNGDWWADWLATSCPTLLMHGGLSSVLSEEHAGEMASRRLNTTLVNFPEMGHGILGHDTTGYLSALQPFLAAL